MNAKISLILVGTALIFSAACGTDHLVSHDPAQPSPDPANPAEVIPAAPTAPEQTASTPARELDTSQPPIATRAWDDSDLELDETVITLRLLGVNPGETTWAGVGVRDIRVSANGQALPYFGSFQPVMNLAWDQNAWTLAKVVLPDDAQTVEFEVTLDDFGGIEGSTAMGAIDTRVAPIRFTAQRDWLLMRGHAVIHLDLSRSLVRLENGDQLLLPRTGVRY